MGEWMDGWMDGWMDEWVDGWMNGRMDSLFSFYLLQCEHAALAQMVACLPLVQQVRGFIPGGVVNFHLKFFNLGARRAGDVHFLITRLYITSLD